MNNIDSNILAVCITGLGSIIVAAITYYKTKKLKFFDVYFNKKTDAYEQFIKSVINYMGDDHDGGYKMVEDLYIAKLYCSQNAFDQLQELVTVSTWAKKKNDFKNVDEIVDQSMVIFREDIKSCRDYNFE